MATIPQNQLTVLSAGSSLPSVLLIPVKPRRIGAGGTLWSMTRVGIFLSTFGAAIIIGEAVAQAQPAHPKLQLEHHLTLAPGPGNSRNSEGDFVRLKDGRWLFIYTHFNEAGGDHASAFLASRESADGGKTWSSQDQLVITNEGGCNVMSVSLLRLHSGEIALFYLRKNSLQDCRPVMRVSRDECQSWSAPVECVADSVGYYVLNNSRVIQLADGRIILPLAQHEFIDRTLQPGRIVLYQSDDSGKSWRRSPGILENDDEGKRTNFMEPGVVECQPGRLRMLIRTRQGCQYTSESTDRGDTWTVPHPSALLSPEAPASLVRIPSTTELLVVWNDQDQAVKVTDGKLSRARNPLAAAISRDDGKTWVQHKLLENEPGHGYCYTAIAFAGNRVLLAYCAHASPSGLPTTRISSFLLEDLER